MKDCIGFIRDIVGRSPLADYLWHDRGRAPPGYLNGMSTMYARLHLRLAEGEVTASEIARAARPGDMSDALTWYGPEFDALGMDVSDDGPETLRHALVLLTGLGMRESSGEYCEGRDMAAENVSAETAEAGLFQTSYNSVTASPLLPTMFASFAGSTELLSTFSEGVICSEPSLRNWGDGAGHEFQRLSKACPAFTVEYAAVAMRHVRTHWGPLNRKEVELRSECDDLFRSVADLLARERVQWL